MPRVDDDLEAFAGRLSPLGRSEVPILTGGKATPRAVSRCARGPTPVMLPSRGSAAFRHIVRSQVAAASPSRSRPSPPCWCQAGQEGQRNALSTASKARGTGSEVIRRKAEDAGLHAWRKRGKVVLDERFWIGSRAGESAIRRQHTATATETRISPTQPTPSSSKPSDPRPPAEVASGNAAVSSPPAERPSSSNVEGSKPISDISMGEVMRLVRLMYPEKRTLTIAGGLLLVSSSVTMSIPFLFGRIIDLFTTQSADLPVSLPTAAGLLAGFFLVGAGANTARVVMMRVAGQRIVHRLRLQSYDAVLRSDIAWHETQGAGAGGKGTGDIMSRLGSDTLITGDAVTRELADAARSLVTTVVGLGMMFLLSTKLTLVMLCVVPPTAVGAVIFGRFLKKLSKQTQEAAGEMIHTAEERLAAIQTVQAFNAVPREKARFKEKVDRIFELAKKESYASGLFFGGSGFTGNLSMIALLTYGGSLVSRGEMSVGDLSSTLLYTVYIGSALVNLTSFFSTFMKSLGASSRVFDLLDATPASVHLGVGRRLEPSEGPKRVVFKDVRFDYPSRPGVDILKGVNLTVEPGTSVAVAGGSGSGKSTLANLLLRYYDPRAETGGAILYGDEDIRKLTPESWRDRIALVPQDPALFGGSIASNIAYGNPSATQSEIEEAARLANALSFIKALPEGFETEVGPRAARLSGGQKQRLAIARALVRKPTLLVLDEATSALDAASEAEVNLAVQRVMESRSLTTILIAHRLSTLKSADRVVFMQDGIVKEQGTFDELSREGSAFNSLVRSQLLGATAPTREAASTPP